MLGLAALVQLGLYVLLQMTVKPVPYSQFLTMVHQGQVQQAVVGSSEIRFMLKDNVQGQKLFRTVPLPDDKRLAPLLEEQKIEVSAVPPAQESWLTRILEWVAPTLIFFGIWFWISRRMRSPSLVLGQSGARLYTEVTSPVRFKDVAGVDEARAELEEVVDFLKRSERYRRLGARIPKGVLLVGPPGTGKTLLARAVAGEAGVPFFSISGSEFIELFVGMGAARVRELFQQAKQKAPCIIFIDELDALGRERAGKTAFGGGGHDEREQTLNQLLTEMDGFEANSGVIILAATNRPEVLDPALRRPGRFDRMVVVDLPDRAGREAILRVHSRTVKLAPSVDLGWLASRTPGFSGADLANLINEATLLAARRNAETVEPQDLSEAVERTIAGLQKRSRVLSDQEKKVVAYHEVGHALVGSLVASTGKVEKVTVVPRGTAALGYTLRIPEDERFLSREDEIRGTLAMLLAGRAAEEVAFGKLTTGAGDDIQNATELAERAVILYGLSKKLGPLAVQRRAGEFLPGESVRRAWSGRVNELADQEIQGWILGALEAARLVLERNFDLLRQAAEELLVRETLEGEELARWLRRVEVPAEFRDWLEKGVE